MKGLIGYINELYPNLDSKETKKIARAYGGAIKDITAEFIEPQLKYLDKIESFDIAKCVLCSKTEKDTWFVQQNGKRVCYNCTVETMLKAHKTINHDDIEDVEGNTEGLEVIRAGIEANESERKMDSVLNDSPDSLGVKVLVQDGECWGNLQDLANIFLSDDIPEDAPIEFAAEMILRLVKGFKERVINKD
jgi:hypothetical protein